tara:strand:+ start:83 stop:304 length:222 start_codon:yes stop_codon:yes gene_type:complete
MKFLLIIIFVIFSTGSLAETKTECEGVLAKLKAECNVIGKSMNKMREFSKENQTLDQVGDNISKGVDKIKKKF